MKMTVEYIRDQVRKIENSAGDYEAAHGLEDELFEDVLTAIAERTCDDPVACAREAVKTTEIEFARYCA